MTTMTNETTESKELAIIDRLNDIYLDLRKVSGTLATITSLCNEESMLEPAPEEVLGMVELFKDIVSPACDELKAIMEEMNEQDQRAMADQKSDTQPKKKDQEAENQPGSKSLKPRGHKPKRAAA